MRKAAAKQYGPGEREIEEVLPVVCKDPARVHLVKPFGRLMNGRGYIVGTDGERLHAVACDAWAEHANPNGPDGPKPPPAERVIPWEAPRIGEISAAALEDASALSSARWTAKLQITRHELRLFASASKGSRSKPSLYPFGRDGVRVDWFKLDQLTFDFAVDLPNLLDAVAFVGSPIVTLWCAGELDPIVLTGGTKEPMKAPRLAVVMPFRL